MSVEWTVSLLHDTRNETSVMCVFYCHLFLLSLTVILFIRFITSVVFCTDLIIISFSTRQLTPETEEKLKDALAEFFSIHEFKLKA